MNFALVFREGLRTLRRNKLRSALTVLGVTIGIGAVICVVAIGRAASAQYQDQLQNLGDNLVWIEAGSRTISGVRLGSHETKSLVLADAEAIGREIRLVKKVSPQVDGTVQIVYGNENWSTVYRGVSPEFLDIRRWSLDQGAVFTQDDVEHAADVCIIGRTIADNLFGAEDPVGKVMRVKDTPCKVIGVLHPKGQSSFGQDQDDVLLMPFTTVQKKIAGITWLKDIMCSAVSPEAVKPAGQQIAELLRERHRIRSDQDDDFNIRSPEDIIQARLAASRTFSLLLLCIGSVSLLVGGIGIMNVMLVSVTERTREIGVRMAVGATEQNVKVQFLGEAILLSLVGGVFGIVLGAVGAFVLGRSLQWSLQISPDAILVAAVFSIAVGTFFGYYPAQKAAQLDPIEALRFE